MKNLAIKALTLLSFVGLMGSFVAYRAGWFGETTSAIQLSPNGSALKTKKLKKQVKKHEFAIKVDSPRKKNPNAKSGKVFKTKTDTGLVVMPSSKSAVIFRPKKKKKLPIMPSSKSGAIFKPKKKKKLPIMPSSKSGVIFTPKKDTSKKKKATKKKK